MRTIFTDLTKDEASALLHICNVACDNERDAATHSRNHLGMVATIDNNKFVEGSEFVIDHRDLNVLLTYVWNEIDNGAYSEELLARFFRCHTCHRPVDRDQNVYSVDNIGQCDHCKKLGPYEDLNNSDALRFAIESLSEWIENFEDWPQCPSEVVADEELPVDVECFHMHELDEAVQYLQRLNARKVLRSMLEDTDDN